MRLDHLRSMSDTLLVYSQLLDWLRLHCRYRDFRHLIALAWMVLGLIGSGRLCLCAWEAHILSSAKAQSLQRRWRRFLGNSRVRVPDLYVSLLLATLQDRPKQRLYLALDTTVLWNRFCMIHISVLCGGRAVPLVWRVLEHNSAAVAFDTYRALLDSAHQAVGSFPDIMLLADRGFANRDPTPIWR